MGEYVPDYTLYRNPSVPPNPTDGAQPAQSFDASRPFSFFGKFLTICLTEPTDQASHPPSHP